MKSRKGVKNGGKRRMALNMGELKKLLDKKVIDEEAYNKAVTLAKQRGEQGGKSDKKLDIYNNHSGELCVVFMYGQRKWIIRVPLFYTIWDYIKLKYPIDDTVARVKQQKSNRALYKELNRNRVKLDELDKKRKVGRNLE